MDYATKELWQKHHTKGDAMKMLKRAVVGILSIAMVMAAVNMPMFTANAYASEGGRCYRAQMHLQRLLN